ncbi:transposase [Candidatus Cetobacterium colombiensis]|uniref:Transposase n=1 Tax=Candidatus Cetobacterium colombiensis TaxID=3073100 RepID=A0ABU4WCN0_9FUSO|nr:transposase [Candidatus Cetobacterium colombiensis]MDX8336145.1 transposase [Candidatus Cetobacterium colombiensis]
MDRARLTDLANAAYQALKYSFKKLGIHSFALIINIHIFARNLDWNPHIHCILTFGGYDKNQKWKNIKTIPYPVLKKSWQKCSLDIIAKYAKDNNHRNLKNKISLCYQKYKKINNIFEIAKYIGRF